MNSEKLYYEAPPQEQFEEMKEKAIELWQTVFKENGGSKLCHEDRIRRVKDIENVRENFMYMLAMCDNVKQGRLFLSLSKQTRYAVIDRLDEKAKTRLVNGVFMTSEFNYDGI